MQGHQVAIMVKIIVTNRMELAIVIVGFSYRYYLSIFYTKEAAVV